MSAAAEDEDGSRFGRGVTATVAGAAPRAAAERQRGLTSSSAPLLQPLRSTPAITPAVSPISEVAIARPPAAASAGGVARSTIQATTSTAEMLLAAIGGSAAEAVRQLLHSSSPSPVVQDAARWPLAAGTTGSGRASPSPSHAFVRTGAPTEHGAPPAALSSQLSVELAPAVAHEPVSRRRVAATAAPAVSTPPRPLDVNAMADCPASTTSLHSPSTDGASTRAWRSATPFTGGASGLTSDGMLRPTLPSHTQVAPQADTAAPAEKSSLELPPQGQPSSDAVTAGTALTASELPMLAAVSPCAADDVVVSPPVGMADPSTAAPTPGAHARATAAVDRRAASPDVSVASHSSVSTIEVDANDLAAARSRLPVTQGVVRPRHLAPGLPRGVVNVLVRPDIPLPQVKVRVLSAGAASLHVATLPVLTAAARETPQSRAPPAAGQGLIVGRRLTPDAPMMRALLQQPNNV
jgi:hypothetical protein